MHSVQECGMGPWASETKTAQVEAHCLAWHKGLDSAKLHIFNAARRNPYASKSGFFFRAEVCHSASHGGLLTRACAIDMREIREETLNKVWRFKISSDQ
ncbi:unnamed protein product [Boreogadus saida]